jgi:hypothetical protein
MKNLPGGRNSGKLSNESIRIISNCPVCNRPYDSLEIKILREDEGSHLLYIKCRHCLSSLLALLTFGMYGISSLALLTDLDSQEISQAGNKPLTCDELLESYVLLKNNQPLAARLTKNDF